VPGRLHGHKGVGAFKSAKQAYETLHIGDVGAAKRLQAAKENKYATKGQHHPGE
jgi:hypothetical protein